MKWIKQFGILVVVGIVGIGVLMYGFWGELGSEQTTVEIVRGELQSSEHSPTAAQGSELGERKQVIVDIAGAVEKPGLYKLPSGSRIGDALVMAGGLAASADREWVAKMINLAELVKDGGKIYIVNKNSAMETPSQSIGKGVTLSGKININTASIGELDSLTGIGEARARLIMDNRPYSKADDLVSKAKIPQSVYEKIKDIITIY